MYRHKPEENRVHTYVVNEIVGPEKTFNSKEGVREKYLIKFREHGYEAEFCPLTGEFSKHNLQPGKRFTFRIRYRKEYRDEIEAAVIEQQQDDGTPKVYSLNGHPANIAIRAAVDLHAAHPAKAGSKPVISDVLADADSIYEWLQKKASGEE